MPHDSQLPDEQNSTSPYLPLIGFSEEAPARLLVNYLNAQNISAHLVNQVSKGTEQSCSFVVVIANEEQAEEAKAICRTFLHNPNDKRFQSVAWESGEAMQQTQPFLPSSHRLFAQISAAPSTFLILLLCVLVYVLFSVDPESTFELLYFQPYEQLVGSGQWWRLWSPAIIHLSILHIAFNVMWWWTLGKDFELLFGHFFVMLFFLITALASNYAQFLVSGSGFGGLSGVVYAMFGCVWWLGWLKPTWGLQLPKPLIGFMLVWMVLGYADVLFISMANTAHSVGLVCGCLIAVLLAKMKNNRG